MSDLYITSDYFRSFLKQLTVCIVIISDLVRARVCPLVYTCIDFRKFILNVVSIQFTANRQKPWIYEKNSKNGKYNADNCVPVPLGWLIWQYKDCFKEKNIEKCWECHNHKPQPTPDTKMKRKRTKLGQKLTCAKQTNKCTRPAPYSPSEVITMLKRMKKQEDKEQGKTIKHEVVKLVKPQIKTE